jgi:hypothetical protein
LEVLLDSQKADGETVGEHDSKSPKTGGRTEITELPKKDRTKKLTPAGGKP